MFQILHSSADSTRSAGFVLWPIFGASNQMLAALTLMVISIYFLKRKKNVLPLVIPMFIVLIITFVSLLQKSIYEFGNNNVLFLISLFLLVLIIWMVIEGNKSIRNKEINVNCSRLNMSKQIDIFEKSKKDWNEEFSKSKSRDKSFDTLSGVSQEPLYYPSEPDNDFMDKLSFPGQFPYTRGIHSSMYRGRLWTMRQFSGFGTPEETNKRYHQLMKNGQTGLSVAYDMPTLMGYDPDHPWSLGEVGKCGVSVSSLDDMRRLFKNINLSEISVSQTINGPAVILLAFYIALAQEQNIPLSKLRGTLQNDILKEFTAQKEWIFPPKPSMRIITDMISFALKRCPILIQFPFQVIILERLALQQLKNLHLHSLMVLPTLNML